MSWIFGDIRKLRPVRGARDYYRRDQTQIDGLTQDDVDYGIYRKNLFYFWPEFSGLEADLDFVSQQWDEAREFCLINFDSTRYACEILKRTILWDIDPVWRSGSAADEDPIRAYGSTSMITEGLKFRIKISVSLLLFKGSEEVC